MSRFSAVGPGTNAYTPKTDMSAGLVFLNNAPQQEHSGFVLDRYARSSTVEYPPINAAATRIPADIVFQWVEWEYMSWFCGSNHEKRDKWNSNNPQIRQRVKTQVLLNYALVCKNWHSVIISSSANPFWQYVAIARFPHIVVHKNIPNWYKFLKDRIQIVQIDFMAPIENCDILLKDPNGACPKIYEKLCTSLSTAYTTCGVCKKNVFCVTNGKSFRSILSRGDIVCMKTRKTWENAMTKHSVGDRVKFTTKESYDESGPSVIPRRRMW